jgi:hypothetical protein
MGMTETLDLIQRCAAMVSPHKLEETPEEHAMRSLGEIVSRHILNGLGTINGNEKRFGP